MESIYDTITLINLLKIEASKNNYVIFEENSKNLVLFSNNIEYLFDHHLKENILLGQTTMWKFIVEIVKNNKALKEGIFFVNKHFKSASDINKSKVYIKYALANHQLAEFIQYCSKCRNVLYKYYKPNFPLFKTSITNNLVDNLYVLNDIKFNMISLCFEDTENSISESNRSSLTSSIPYGASYVPPLLNISSLSENLSQIFETDISSNNIKFSSKKEKYNNTTELHPIYHDWISIDNAEDVTEYYNVNKKISPQQSLETCINNLIKWIQINIKLKHSQKFKIWALSQDLLKILNSWNFTNDDITSNNSTTNHNKSQYVILMKRTQSDSQIFHPNILNTKAEDSFSCPKDKMVNRQTLKLDFDEHGDDLIKHMISTHLSFVSTKLNEESLATPNGLRKLPNPNFYIELVRYLKEFCYLLTDGRYKLSVSPENILCIARLNHLAKEFIRKVFESSPCIITDSEKNVPIQCGHNTDLPSDANSTKVIDDVNLKKSDLKITNFPMPTTNPVKSLFQEILESRPVNGIKVQETKNIPLENPETSLNSIDEPITPCDSDSYYFYDEDDLQTYRKNGGYSRTTFTKISFPICGDTFPSTPTTIPNPNLNQLNRLTDTLNRQDKRLTGLESELTDLLQLSNIRSANQNNTTQNDELTDDNFLRELRNLTQHLTETANECQELKSKNYELTHHLSELANANKILHVRCNELEAKNFSTKRIYETQIKEFQQDNHELKKALLKFIREKDALWRLARDLEISAQASSVGEISSTINSSTPNANNNNSIDSPSLFSSTTYLNYSSYLSPSWLYSSLFPKLSDTTQTSSTDNATSQRAMNNNNSNNNNLFNNGHLKSNNNNSDQSNEAGLLPKCKNCHKDFRMLIRKPYPCASCRSNFCHYCANNWATLQQKDNDKNYNRSRNDAVLRFCDDCYANLFIKCNHTLLPNSNRSIHEDENSIKFHETSDTHSVRTTTTTSSLSLNVFINTMFDGSTATGDEEIPPRGNGQLNLKGIAHKENATPQLSCRLNEKGQNNDFEDLDLTINNLQPDYFWIHEV